MFIIYQLIIEILQSIKRESDACREQSPTEAISYQRSKTTESSQAPWIQSPNTSSPLKRFTIPFKKSRPRNSIKMLYSRWARTSRFAARNWKKNQQRKSQLQRQDEQRPPLSTYLPQQRILKLAFPWVEWANGQRLETSKTWWVLQILVMTIKCFKCCQASPQQA